MAIEIQEKKILLNSSVMFSFNNTICAYVLGISKLYYTYGDSDHWLEKILLQLNANQTDGQLTVNPTYTMADKSGHQLSSASYVNVVAVALTGSNDGTVSLNNENSIDSGSRSSAIALPGTPVTAQSILSGFDLTFGTADHEVECISALVGSDSSGVTGYITASAELYDNSGNAASSATVNGGLICATVQKPGFYIIPICTRQNINYPVTGLPTDYDWSKAQAMVTQFKAQYSTDHYIKSLSFGVDSLTLNTTGDTITMNKMGAFMSDSSNNSQNNIDSHVSMILIAPAL